MSTEEFKFFVELIVEELNNSLIQNNRFKISNKTTPTEFEKIVLKASELVKEKFEYNFSIEYTEGGHAFPDIVFNFNNVKYGIEVKSSTNANSSDNSWTILGNSILGSTRIDVEDIFILFIKVNKNGCFIKYSKYEDAVSDVVVTHSPRYKLNLSQKPEDSFFSRSGISYEEMVESNDPIGLVTDYFREQGETAWWITESTPATIKNWNELSENNKKEILSKAFLLFPELIYSNNSKKYKRLSKWLVVNYSVVDSSLRDRFTAGGKINLHIDNTIYKSLPRIYETLQNIIEEFNEQLKYIPIEDLNKYWSNYNPKIDNYNSRKNYWFTFIKNNYDNNPNAKIELEFLFALISKVNRP